MCCLNFSTGSRWTIHFQGRYSFSYKCPDTSNRLTSNSTHQRLIVDAQNSRRSFASLFLERKIFQDFKNRCVGVCAPLQDLNLWSHMNAHISLYTLLSFKLAFNSHWLEISSTQISRKPKDALIWPQGNCTYITNALISLQHPKAIFCYHSRKEHRWFETSKKKIWELEKTTLS